MEIEDIAKIDLFLKSKNGFQNVFDIDSLIVVEKDQNAATKLKDAAYRLQNIPNEANEEIKSTWINFFSKQIRYSVNRVKQKKSSD